MVVKGTIKHTTPYLCISGTDKFVIHISVINGEFWNTKLRDVSGSYFGILNYKRKVDLLKMHESTLI